MRACGHARTIWDIARVHPADHPVTRIATLAALLGEHGTDLIPELLSAVRDHTPIAPFLQGLVADSPAPPLGADRAIAIAASVVLPLAVAYAHCTGDDILEDSALRTWAELPIGAMSQAARRARQQVAGDIRITGLREQGMQGLLYLDRQFCGPRRRYGCPVARTVVTDELAQPISSRYTPSSASCS